MCFKTTASLYNSVAKELQTHIYKKRKRVLVEISVWLKRNNKMAEYCFSNAFFYHIKFPLAGRRSSTCCHFNLFFMYYTV